jgi:hypothetical protein
VRTVLGTEDVGVLDRVGSELKAGDLSPERHRQLLDEGIVANDQLLARLDETLGRIQAFRDERAATGVKLRERRRLLDEADGADGGDGGAVASVAVPVSSGAGTTAHN